MFDGRRYPFHELQPAAGPASLMPLLPLSLAYGDRVVRVTALLDTGSSVNVMPLHVGEELGAIWGDQRPNVRLTGSLGALQAKALILNATVGEFEPVRLAFAWADSNDVPLILGQVNFFLEFDVCFYRYERTFELRHHGVAERSPGA